MRAALGALVLVAAMPSTAAAQTTPSTAAPALAPASATDTTVAARPPADAQPAPEQPFLYMSDTRGPLPRHFLAGYALAFSSSPGAIRPLPGRFDQEAVVHDLSLEAGLLPRLSLYGAAWIAQPIGQTSVGNVAVQAGARVWLTDPRARRFRLVTQIGFLREFGADLGVVGEVTGSWDIGRLRLAAAVHGEHLFAAGRDPIDLYVVAGASVRVASFARVGAEYVVEDLEAAFDGGDDAERGVRQYLGPDVAWSLFRDRLLVTTGAAAQLARAPGVLARAALTYVY
jgi:hypothetical protein